MTPEQAAWVREHALPIRMRRLHSLCHCTEPAARCFYCAGGPTPPQHGIGNGVELTPETWIYNKGGNPVSLGRTGSVIDVWLADRICRRVCSCSCHAASDEPPPAPEPVDPTAYDLVPLFDLTAS